MFAQLTSHATPPLSVVTTVSLIPQTTLAESPAIGDPLPSSVKPRDPHEQPGENSGGAVQRRPSTRNRKGRSIPMPPAAVRKEHFESGAWIYQHSCLDDECRMFPEFEIEYRRTRLEALGFEQHNAQL